MAVVRSHLGFELKSIYTPHPKTDDTNIRDLLPDVLDSLTYLSTNSDIVWYADFRCHLTRQDGITSVTNKIFFIIEGPKHGNPSSNKFVTEIYSVLDLAFGRCGLVFNAIKDCQEPDVFKKHLIPFEFKKCYELFRTFEARPYNPITFGKKPGLLSDIYYIAHNLELQMCSSLVISPRNAFDANIEHVLQDFPTKFNKSPYIEDERREHDPSIPRPIGYQASLRLMFDRPAIPEFAKRGLLTSLSGGPAYLLHEVNSNDREKFQNSIYELSPNTFFEKTDESKELSDSALKIHVHYEAKDLMNFIIFPDTPLPGVEFNSFPNITTSSELLPNVGSRIGLIRKQGRAEASPLYQSTEDRFRHAYVIGKTGTGKSSFLLNLILNDIISEHAVVVVDPHGDLVDKVLERIPRSRTKDIVLFDVTDTASPPGFNPLHISQKELDASARGRSYAETFAINQLNEFFIKYYGMEAYGPRIQDYFVNACKTVMALKPNDGSITDVVLLILDEKYQNELLGPRPQREKLDKVTDETIKWFWKVQMARTRDDEQDEMIPYYASKFTPFMHDRLIKPIISPPSERNIDLADAIDNNKIILLKLTKGMLGELGMGLVGTLLVSRIVNYVLSRGARKKDRKPVFLYIDEFQNFISDYVTTSLSEARKYSFGLTLAHQFIAQLEKESSFGGKGMKQAIFGNVGSLYAFRCGVDDAEAIAKAMGEPNLAEYIVNLHNFYMFGKILSKDEPRGPFLIRTINAEAEDVWPITK